MTKINFGCGKFTKPDWVNVDITPLSQVDVVADLNSPLPFGYGTIDEMLLSHIIEHLSYPLKTMQELYRIANPNAKLQIRVPYGSSDDSWEDPTHVRPYFLGSFGYFSQPFYWKADYGYRGDWQTESILLIIDPAFKGKGLDEVMLAVTRFRNVVREMVATLVAIKPIRQPLRELQVSPPIKIDFAA